MPEDMSDRMPEDMPDRMPDHMPEDMPDRMPNRMSEDMSDRMPEDLPVRKCINVMVGITRSKVILCFSEFQDVQRTSGAGSSKRPEISLDKRSLILLSRFHWECVDGYIGRIISYISSQVPPQKKHCQRLRILAV